MEELLKKIFPDGYVCRRDGNWTGYVGFHGNDALSLQVNGTWRLRLGLEVFSDFGTCNRETLEEVHQAILDSGLVTPYYEMIDMKKIIRYELVK